MLEAKIDLFGIVIIEILLILKKYKYDFFLITINLGLERFVFEEDFLKLCKLIKNQLNEHEINLEIRFARIYQVTIVM